MDTPAPKREVIEISPLGIVAMIARLERWPDWEMGWPDEDRRKPCPKQLKLKTQ